MKVIFLDYDGVLNNSESWKKRHEYFLEHGKFISETDEETIKRLSQIVEVTGAKVVLTASCRGDWARGIENIHLDSSKELQALFDKYGIEVVGVTPWIEGIDPDGKYHSSWREKEIKKYLETHPEVDSFCVIDDELSDLTTLEEYLIKTDTKIGLEDKHIVEAITVLGKICVKENGRRI